MSIFENQPRFIKTMLSDAIIINGVIFIKMYKKKRNRHLKNHLSYYNIPHIVMKKPPGDYYYYVGGLKLAEEIDRLGDGALTDVIGKKGMNEFRKFWSKYDEKIPLSIAYILQTVNNKNTISLLNRHYYIFNYTLSNNIKHFKFNISKFKIYIKEKIDKSFKPDVYHSKFIFMTKDYKNFIPFNTEWEYVQKLFIGSMPVRFYPKLGKSTDKFIIVDSIDTLNHYTEEFGEEFMILYLYLEKRSKK